MKLIKNKKIFQTLGIISIIFSLIFMTISSKGQEQATEPITYDFYNDSIFDIDQENNPDYYNIRNQSEYTSNYLSGYTTIEQLESIFLSDNSETNSYYQTESLLEGHSDVLVFYTSGTPQGDFRLSYDFDDQSNGVIEFWILTNNTYATNRFYVFHDDNSHVATNYLFWIQFNFNLLRVRGGNGGGGNQNYEVFDSTPSNNTWYHVELNISCTTNTFDCYVNNRLRLDDITFYNDQDFDSFNCIETFSNGDGDSYEYYMAIDGLDFSWISNYIHNRNFLPQTNNFEYMEVDKYEFDYSNDDFHSGFTHWRDYNPSGYGTETVASSSNTDINKYIQIWTPATDTYQNGFYWNATDSNAMIINVSTTLEILTDDSWNSFIVKYRFDSDLGYVSYYIKFNGNTGNCAVWNTTLGNYEGVFTYDLNTEYYINCYFNFYDDIVIVRITAENDDSYFATYTMQIDGTYENLYGLDEIIYYNSMSAFGSLAQINIYDTGIYENGLSYLRNYYEYEFGLLNYYINDDWNSDNHNLLTIDSINDYELYIHEYDTYFKDGYKARERNNQTESETINFQDNLDNNYPKFIKSNPYLIFQLYGNFTNFYELEIEGIQLINQDNNYVYGNYYYNNTDSNYNWFYAVDNKLYYNFNNNDSIGLETMRISFNVYDVLLTNQSLISYSSYITNNYTGNIYVRSYHLRESFSITNNNSITNSYMNMTDTSHFTLTEISIELQTNKNSSGLANGFIRNINIYPEKPLFPDFDDINYLDSTFIEKMIETIIPIIFFIVPSLAFRSKLGSKIVIPIWILFTLIYTIAGFIPFWICFIIFLGIGFIEISKEKVLE